MLALFMAYNSINRKYLVYSLKDSPKAYYQGLRSVQQGFQSWVGGGIKKISGEGSAQTED